ncbi:MAG: glycosyltransferase family 9 protein, partial [Phycisphaeraceae bacterium]
MGRSGRKRLLVYFPTWLGDGVMATVALSELRGVFAESESEWEVVGYPPRGLRGLFKPLAGVDRWLGRRPGMGVWAEACWLRGLGFDAVLLLPNSFRSALVVWLAGIPRRIGYARDGRGWLLTDRAEARREGGKWAAEPAVDYYLRLVRGLGGGGEEMSAMRLVVTEAQRRKMGERLEALGVGAGDRVVVLNPGASKVMKRWPAERYGALADRLAETFGVVVVVSGSPGERGIAGEVVASSETGVVDVTGRLSVSLLKALMERAELLVTNDTGPRHVAAAVGTSVVTLFGPTGPEWTVIPFDRDVHVIARDRR